MKKFVWRKDDMALQRRRGDDGHVVFVDAVDGKLGDDYEYPIVSGFDESPMERWSWTWSSRRVRRRR